LIDLEIAEITFDAERRRILNITFSKKDLRFKCKRCSVFCCKLGGPPVTEADLKRMAKTRINPYDFLEPLTSRHSRYVNAVGILKRKKDGSCIFLEYDRSKRLYECRIYEARPDLCRLYPFEFTSKGNGKGVLKIIPCCNGLNTPDGRIVDQEFVEKYLLDAIRAFL